MHPCKMATIAVFTLVFTLFVMSRTVTAQTQYDIQVGAWGNDASRGNMGVGAEISTRITPPTGQDLADSFWVGDNLQNGAFLQFGYQLTTPGYYCLYAIVMGDQGNCLGSSGKIGHGDARWFWQYWPNPTETDFYYATGPADSAGSDGSWHLYQISPNAGDGWNFVLDGRTVWNFNVFQVSKSRDPAYMVAEEITGNQSTSGSLGPVEFRNLSYWDNYKTWQPVTSLSAISGCGGVDSNCDISIPYGVTVLGANDIIAGTGEQLIRTGSLLWPRTFMLTVSAPSEVPVTIDGLPYAGGLADVPLLQGSHSISVPDIVNVDSMNRLRFNGWSDGSTTLIRVINLNSDTNLQAIYVQQYKLTIASPFPISVDGWYNQGSTADFNANLAPHVTNTLGLMIFVGWYNQDGALVTHWGSGSIVMEGPNILEEHWLTMDYFIPIALTTLFALVVVARLRSKESE